MLGHLLVDFGGFFHILADFLVLPPCLGGLWRVPTMGWTLKSACHPSLWLGGLDHNPCHFYALVNFFGFFPVLCLGGLYHRLGHFLADFEDGLTFLLSCLPTPNLGEFFNWLSFWRIWPCMSMILMVFAWFSLDFSIYLLFLVFWI